MRHRVLILAGGLALAGAIAVAAAPADANVLVQIDKSTQQMTVSVDGQLRWQWPVSTGRPGRDTPSGTFRAFRMEADHFSKEFDDAPMPHSIFFTKIGHAIHGYLDTRNIGMPASHGCVRLDPANATKLYSLVEQQGVLNTTVVISGDARIALARGRAPAAQATEASAEPEAAPSYGYGYRDDRGSGYGDNRGYGYGYSDNRSSGYGDNRTHGYRDERSYSASTDERYAPLQQRPAPYDGQQQSGYQPYGDQQSAYPAPPPGYPPYPRPWR
ncbi:MAG TPA: L,D-transpeptidase [Xanthobacteraceae bacterium]|nr:L,D-transpeptidase [Xanthobacteraceae bacterium]